MAIFSLVVGQLCLLAAPRGHPVRQHSVTRARCLRHSACVTIVTRIFFCVCIRIPTKGVGGCGVITSGL